MSKVKTVLERLTDEKEALDKEHAKLSVIHKKVVDDMNDVNNKRVHILDAIRAYSKAIGEE
jgi:hypothetical protein